MTSVNVRPSPSAQANDPVQEAIAVAKHVVKTRPYMCSLWLLGLCVAAFGALRVSGSQPFSALFSLCAGLCGFGAVLLSLRVLVPGSY